MSPSAWSAASPADNSELNESEWELRKLPGSSSPTLIQVTRPSISVITSARVGTFAWSPGYNPLCKSRPSGLRSNSLFFPDWRYAG